MLKKTYIIVSLLAVGLLSQACGDDPAEERLEVSHSNIRTGVDSNVRAVFPDAEAIPTVWEESEVLRALVGPDDEIDCPPDVGGEFECSEEEGEPISGAELAELLLERIFVDANIESADAYSVTYRIPEEFFCPDEDDAIADGGPGSEDGPTPGFEEEECQNPFGELRVRVSSSTEGNYDLEILVGSGRANPIDLRVYRTELAVALDLGALKSVLTEIEQRSGEQFGLPEVMRGVVDVALRHPGESIYEARISVTQEIEIRSDDPEAPINVKIAPANPVVSLSVDVEAKTATAEVGLGAIDLTAPLAFFSPSETICYPSEVGEEPVCEESEAPEGTIAIHLGGLTGRADFERDSDVLRLSELGLGDETTTIHIDGQQVLAADFNAALGRRVNLTLSREGEDLRAEVAPAFDLALALDMQHTNLDAPQWAMDEDLHILLDGAEPAILRILEESGALQVVQGRLQLSSTTYGELSVGEGMCLWSPDEEDSFSEGEEISEGDDHPFAGITSDICE